MTMLNKCGCPAGIFRNPSQRFAQMTVIELPPGTERDRRIKDGLSPSVCIDPCIVEEIKSLWGVGINTLGCCCGHNVRESFVNVSDSDIPRMISMGYVQNHPDPERKDTFRLKSAG